MKIIWSDFAIENLKDIFDYYKIKVSKKMPTKLGIKYLNQQNNLYITLNLVKLNLIWRNSNKTIDIY